MTVTAILCALSALGGMLLTLFAVGAGQHLRYRRRADARRPQAESPADLERRLRAVLRASDGVPREVRSDAN